MRKSTPGISPLPGGKEEDASALTAEIVPFDIGAYDEARGLWLRCEGVNLTDADTEEVIRSFLARNPGMSFAAAAGGRIVGTVLGGHDGKARLHVPSGGRRRLAETGHRPGARGRVPERPEGGRHSKSPRLRLYNERHGPRLLGGRRLDAPDRYLRRIEDRGIGYGKTISRRFFRRPFILPFPCPRRRFPGLPHLTSRRR